MDTETLIQSVVTLIENDLAVKWPSRALSHEINALVDQWKSTNEGMEVPDVVKWEVSALDMMAVHREQREGAPDIPFRPLSEWYDRSTNPPSVLVYPDVVGLLSNEQAITYYRARVQATQNPIRKARYADIVWTALNQQGGREAYRYALEAAPSYLALIPLCIQQAETIRLVEILDRVAEIAVRLNNRNLALQTIQAVIDSLSQLNEGDRSRWVLEMGDTLDYLDGKFRDLVTNQVWQNIQDISLVSIDYFENVVLREPPEPRNLSIIHELMQLASVASAHLGDHSTAWHYQVQIAESLEREARERENQGGTTGGAFVAYKFMEEAMHTYLNLVSRAPSEEERRRLEENVENTRREVRRLIRLAEGEVGTISGAIDIDRAELEAMVLPFLQMEPAEVFERLSRMSYLVPNIDQLEQQASQADEEFIFTRLASHTILRDGRKVDETPAMGSNDRQFLFHLGLWFQLHGHLLDFIFYRLKQEDRFTADTFIAHLNNWDFLDDTDMPFIEVGLERYFAEDYVSALHVLVPRIEHMMKSAFEQSGLPSVAVKSKRQIREQTFGDFLRRGDVRQIIGESIWYYFSYSLLDERGLNLRNDVAHGWIQESGCNRVSVQIVLFAILLVTRIRRPASMPTNSVLGKLPGMADLMSEPSEAVNEADEGGSVE